MRRHWCSGLWMMVLLMAGPALAEPRWLRGKVLVIDEDDLHRPPAASATVRVTGVSESARTPPGRGDFQLRLPDSLQPGAILHMNVTLEGFKVCSPDKGLLKWSAEDTSALVLMVPEGTKALADCSERMRRSVSKFEALHLLDVQAARKRTLEERLEIWLAFSGLDLDDAQRQQLRDDMVRWMMKDVGSEEARATAALLRQDPAAAVRHGNKAAAQGRALRELGRKQELRGLSTAGSANVYLARFDEALASLTQALDLVTPEELHTAASLKLSIATVQVHRSRSRDLAEARKLFEEAERYYREAMEAYASEALVQHRLMTRGHLAFLLAVKGERLPGAEGLRQLRDAERLYRELLEVTPPWPLLYRLELQDRLNHVLVLLSERLGGRKGMEALAEAKAVLAPVLEECGRQQAGLLKQGCAMARVRQGTLLWLMGRESEGAAAARMLAEAEQGLREVEKELHPEKQPLAWAAARTNLASVLWARSEHATDAAGSAGLDEALELLQTSRRVLTPMDHPQERARAQHMLATVLMTRARGMSGGDGTKRWEEAEQALQAILQEATRKDLTYPRALARLALGHLELARSEGFEEEPRLRHLRRAEAAFRQALEVFSAKTLPGPWGQAQVGLAGALQAQGSLLTGARGLRLLKEAEGIYRKALEVHDLQHQPQQWAHVRAQLALTLHGQGELMDGAAGLARLEEAVKEYREALRVFTPGHPTRPWASTLKNLGLALHALGEQTPGAAGVPHFKAAVEAYQQALAAYPKDHPKWMELQYSLGCSFQRLGMRIEEAEAIVHLKAAVEAFHQALRTMPREQRPFVWGTAQENLGAALTLLGGRVRGDAGIQYLEQGVESFLRALEVFTREQWPVQRQKTWHWLVQALEFLETLYAEQLKQPRPQDIGLVTRLAENTLLRGQDAKTLPLVGMMLKDRALHPSVHVRLRVLELIALLRQGGGGRGEAEGRLEALHALIAAQPRDFQLPPRLQGVTYFADGGDVMRSFIREEARLAPWRAWLLELLRVLQARDRDAMLETLESCRGQLQARAPVP